MSTRRWLGLDGLRGVAVLAVVLFHAGLAPGGFVGVDVFFVLSGFLITGLLRAEYSRTGSIRLVRFTVRRLMRLYPALLGVCLFVMAVAIAAQRAVPEVAHDVLHALTYTSNLVPMQSGLLDHTWTLSLEEQFYLMWPVLLLMAVRTSSPWAWVPAIGILAAIFSTDLLQGQTGALHTYVRAMGLPLGCALAFAGSHVLRWLRAVAIPSAIGLLIVFFVPLPSFLTTGWPISIGAILAVPLVATLLTIRFPPLERGPMRWLGLRSYSLYLWHLPIMALVLFHAPPEVPEWLRVVSGVGVSLMIAELSYRFVEQPVLRLRDRTRPEPGEPSPARPPDHAEPDVTSS
ncbi:acyltransferase [uncultured Microbacterium sp.]|uniref:acyltransferase family protein n=1 Tax=uncultured Microbacterium sp. TaxID=191216 RepID=UPI0028D21AD1|nr:acyltransferase [uncultured Microbacterium sp.]